MRRRFWSDAKRGLRGERGAIAVEAAIILPVVILLILGGMDLGHRYYIQYITSNASREGARYAAKYRLTSTDLTSEEISAYVKSELNYNSFGLDTLTVSRTYDGASPNRIVTVRVQAVKNWWILGGLLGSNATTVTATTAMNVES
jgi:Flp pilus assembly protein TadG